MVSIFEMNLGLDPHLLDTLWCPPVLGSFKNICPNQDELPEMTSSFYPHDQKYSYWMLVEYIGVMFTN